MLYDAKNRTVNINGIPMSYVEFGSGQMPLVLLPGLVDGLTTVKGQALNLAYFYRKFTKKFKIYVFSRKDTLDVGCTTKDMAEDLKVAFDSLGIESAHVLGVSQGGMIAQCFAIAYPDRVKKLVVAVSAARQNDILRNAVGQWISWGRANDYKSLMIDTLEKTYSPQKLKTYRMIYPLISRVGKPKDFSRFLIQADACLTHNVYDELVNISCPTLIIGGDCDKIVGPDSSPEIACKIRNSKLYVYKGLGHGAYEEGKDFNERVMNFLLSSN